MRVYLHNLVLHNQWQGANRNQLPELNDRNLIANSMAEPSGETDIEIGRAARSRCG